MRAVRVHTFGGGVSVDEVPEPAVETDEALFEVCLAAVNPLDLWVAEGSVAGGTQELPFILGTEAVGVSDGQRVVASGLGLGSTRDGLYRPLAAVPPETLSPVPDQVDDHQAASVSVVGVTARRVIEVAGLAAGERLAIFGPSGGVGVVAIQLARREGATVVAVTSRADKRDRLIELGADEVVIAGADFSLPAELTQTFEVVFNPLGGQSVSAGFDLLRIGGRQVLYGRSIDDAVAFSAGSFYRKNLSLLSYGGLSDPLEERVRAREWMLDRLAAGEVSIPVALELPLERAADALAAVAQGMIVGKVLLRVGAGGDTLGAEQS